MDAKSTSAPVSFEELQQQLTNLQEAYEFLAMEYGRVLYLSGWSENKTSGYEDAIRWIKPEFRPEE